MRKYAILACFIVIHAAPARAQIVPGLGLITVTSSDIYKTLTFPTFRVSFGYPTLPVRLGVEYGTTHPFSDPWYGDYVVSSTGIGLSLKLYRFLGLELSYHSIDQTHVLNSDGFYYWHYPSYDTYGVSLLIFAKDMSNLAIGFTTQGELKLSANVQIFGAEEWRAITAGSQ